MADCDFGNFDPVTVEDVTKEMFDCYLRDYTVNMSKEEVKIIKDNYDLLFAKFYPNRNDTVKVEAIKDVLRKYFEWDPWSDAPSQTYSETYDPQSAIDDILVILDS